ncbi:hypothetical protein ACFSYD_14125 [Paracoccus aerius]
MTAPQHIVVMGVSGSGKTTTGTALADLMGWPFIEGDSFHPAANLRKMAEGIPWTTTTARLGCRPWPTRSRRPRRGANAL